MQSSCVTLRIDRRDHRNKAHRQGRRQDLREVDQRHDVAAQGAVEHRCFAGRIPRCEQAAVDDRYFDHIHDRHHGRTDGDRDRDEKDFLQDVAGRFVHRVRMRVHPVMNRSAALDIDKDDQRKPRRRTDRRAGDRTHRAFDIGRRRCIRPRPGQECAAGPVEYVCQRQAEAHAEHLLDDLRDRRRVHVLHTLEVPAVRRHQRHHQQRRCDDHHRELRVRCAHARGDRPRAEEKDQEGHRPDAEHQRRRDLKGSVRAAVVPLHGTLGYHPRDGHRDTARRDDDKERIYIVGGLVVRHGCLADHVAQRDAEHRAEDLDHETGRPQDRRPFYK